MSDYTFTTPDPIDVYVENGAGDLTLRCTDTTQTTVEIRPNRERDREGAERTTVGFDSGRLRIEAPSRRFALTGGAINILVTAPIGSRLDATVGSADVRCGGPMGGLQVRGASGDVTVEQVTGDADVQLASGDLRAGTVTGTLHARTASGDLRLDQVGGLEATTASGDITVGTISGNAQLHAASGDVRIADAAGGGIAVTTASGDIAVAVRPGTALRLDLNSRSGDVRSELAVEDAPPETGATLSLQLRSLSGDIVVRRGSVPSTVS
jgi:Putative adhesin